MKVVTHFLVILLTVAPVCSYAGTCFLASSPQQEILKLKESSEKIEKVAQIEFAKNDPADFCEKNLQLRYLNVNPKNTAEVNFKCTEMTRDQLESYTNKALLEEVKVVNSRNRSFQAWWYSLVPTKLSQTLSLLPGTAIDEKGLASMSPKEAQGYAEESSRNIIDSYERILQTKTIPVRLKQIGQSKITTPDVEAKELAQNAGICGDLKITKAIECTKGLSEIREITRPVHYDDLVFMPTEVWSKFAAEQDSYKEGLRIMALKMTRNLKNKSTDGSNVFDDLVNSFRQAGLNQKEATDKTWDILALYGNGGANLGERVHSLARNAGHCNNGVDNNVCTYMDIIGRAIPALDFVNSRSGKPLYSFPKGIEAKCNTGKSYHFWLAAYLSRSLIEKQYSPEAAEISAYAGSVGYQIERNKGLATESNHGKNALRKSTYDPVSQIIRADMAYSRAGAAYGAGVNSKRMSVDGNLEELLKQSKPSAEDYSKTNISAWDQLRRYQRFKEIIAPQGLVD